MRLNAVEAGVAPLTAARLPSAGVLGPRRIAHAAISLLAYGAASLLLTALVAVAAHGLEQPPAGVWVVEGTATDTAEQDPWCKTLNGRPVCVGEPD